jgi:hypothetical protein
LSCSETFATFPILAKEGEEVLPASNLLACNLSRFTNWVQIAPLKWGTHSAEGMGTTKPGPMVMGTMQLLVLRNSIARILHNPV